MEEDVENGWERPEINEIPYHGPFLVTPGLNLDTESRKQEDFFNTFFDNGMFTIIADVTNDYAHKKIRSLLEDRHPTLPNTIRHHPLNGGGEQKRLFFCLHSCSCVQHHPAPDTIQPHKATDTIQHHPLSGDGEPKNVLILLTLTLTLVSSTIQHLRHRCRIGAVWVLDHPALTLALTSGTSARTTSHFRRIYTILFF